MTFSRNTLPGAQKPRRQPFYCYAHSNIPTPLKKENINTPKMFSFCELFTLFDNMYVKSNMLKLGPLCVLPLSSTQAMENVQSNY